jgi:hypothetical protein
MAKASRAAMVQKNHSAAKESRVVVIAPENLAAVINASVVSLSAAPRLKLPLNK